MHCLARRALPWLVLGVVSSTSLSGTQGPAAGQIVEKVTCANAAGQTYALYLPSRYSPDRPWPILYAFDAGARGLLPVQRFRDAAERYGYIVAGSNNSRNGPIEVANEALRAMVADTMSRFSIDPKRVYAAGFSGGARVAVLAAIASRQVVGVIGCGAGFPPDFPPSASMTFAYFGTAGTDDFNYPEMKQLDDTLEKLGVPHRLEVFEGTHDWPPPEVCTRALEWMEVQAMRSTVRARDDELLDRILATDAADAAVEEKAGRLYDAYSHYGALATMFAGLRDVTAYAQKARQLAGVRAVRRVQSERATSIERQLSADARFARLADEAVAGDDPGSAIPAFLQDLAALKSQSDRPTSDAFRMAARRVLSATWIRLNDATAGDMASGQFMRAAARLSLMARIRPDNSRVDYTLARAYARAGKRNAAVQALQSAVRKGFTDVAAIEAEPDFESLRGEDGFRKIVAGLGKDPTT